MKHAIFMILFFPISLFAQRASGIYNSQSGFSKVNWSFSHEVEMAEGAREDLNGPLFVTFSEKQMTVDGSRFQYNGKSYSPSEAGMSSWPEVNLEYASMECDVDVLYKGSVIKHYNALSVKYRSVLIGRFDSQKGTPPNDVIGIVLGNQHVPSKQFNLSDMRIMVSNVRVIRYNSGGDRVIASILEKEKNGQNNKSAVRETVTISSTSSTDNNISPSNKNQGSSTNVSSTKKTQDTDSQYQEQMRIYNQTMKAAEEKRKADAEQSQKLAEGITQFAGGIMASIAADAERKALNEEKRREADERNKEKANILLQTFLSSAENGNEDAIQKVEQAYSLLEKPYKHFDEIRKDGYYSTYEPTKYIGFLNKMYSTYQSEFARKALLTYYSSEVNAFQQVVKDHRRKAIVRPILAGVIAAGGILGGSKLIDQEIENNNDATFSPGVIAQSVGALGGATLFLSGIVHLVRIGQSQNDEHYISSKNKLGKVKARDRLSFSPTYDSRNSNWGVAIRLHF